MIHDIQIKISNTEQRFVKQFSKDSLKITGKIVVTQSGDGCFGVKVIESENPLVDLSELVGKVVYFNDCNFEVISLSWRNIRLGEGTSYGFLMRKNND